MRLFALMLFCTALVTISAEPDPKKYKAEIKDKDKQLNTTLTSDEKKFLREVEDKFGIKSDASKEEKKNDKEEKPEKLIPGHTPFPAVIAIEIVNDTDTKGSKGKRTIDANLGYGYKTNNGYTYSYFGKPAQEKGKFMVYPYSQEDIPPADSHSFNHYDHSGKPIKTSVEIQPSQAFELVPVKEKTPYQYNKPVIEFKTPSPTSGSYSPSAGQNSNSYSPHPSTLYTTYNGEQFTGLTGQFPSVMPDYLVDPTQLIKNPEYQNVGLTQDHLRTHGSHLEQKVVPVLVLRIPSSSLTNPTAELYANLPNNYPLSHSLNNLNLQELVNQYFKKLGYNFAPQVMAYHSSISSGAESHGHGQSHPSVPQYEPQHYAPPYVQPSYTQSHHSGVQYSAVQPVMARYPSSYVRQHYMTMPKGYSLYKQPALPQKYEYRYQYTNSHAPVSSQKFYLPSSHYQQQTEHVASQEVQGEQHVTLAQGAGGHDGSTQVQYEEQSHVSAGYETAVSPGPEYGAPQQQTIVEYENSNTVAPEYGSPRAQSVEAVQAGYETAGTPAPEYGPAQESAVSPGAHQYYSQSQQEQIDAHSAYPSQSAQSIESQADLSGHQNYVYQQQQQQQEQYSSGHQDSNGPQAFVISENYPSKDHTIATVLPTHYKTDKQQNSGAVQSVSYVTPSPQSSKYQMPYKVMVPQTYLHNPTTERVSYVNSHPISPSYTQAAQHQDYNPEAEYTVGLHYVPPVGKQKPPPYPRNYHSHPKRMAKPENRQESSSSSFSKNKNDRNEKKRLS